MLTLSMVACAQTPPEVSSTLPLLSASPDSLPNPRLSRANAALIEDQQNAIVFLGNGQKVEAGVSYFSALGYSCVKLSAMGQNERPLYTACKIEGNWVLLPVVSTTSGTTR
ncbi:hypothetical protein [Grimontia hollisae]|uniref:Uncharacterized protein n=1 Tax=Grimontia hollisae TaxID=673 RepID=A0A377HMJ8_GRIHO|nr:hypothetical protein [Grimontia hollisae]MDF2184449.1 hypothetical protein [Grimontia hollisae]STO57324.1 Uncharacterised protein [Grimontia hollisae]STQ75191.1 Uncharacterised protein [Grimontia hollisae]